MLVRKKLKIEFKDAESSAHHWPSNNVVFDDVNNDILNYNYSSNNNSVSSLYALLYNSSVLLRLCFSKIWYLSLAL